MRYELQDAPSGFNIDIDPETGVMTAAQRLEGDGGDYTFTVRATDMVSWQNLGFHMVV